MLVALPLPDLGLLLRHEPFVYKHDTHMHTSEDSVLVSIALSYVLTENIANGDQTNNTGI